MKNPQVRMLTEGGIMIALSVILSHITLYQMPQGGSVSLGGMLPLLLFALRWGTGPGILVGAIYGLLDFIIKPYFFSVPQVLLDYPISYGLLGLSGFGAALYAKHQNLSFVLGFSFLGIFGRFMGAVASGYVFFAEYAPEGMNPLWYTITYNASYILPDAILAAFLLVLIFKPVMRTLPQPQA